MPERHGELRSQAEAVVRLPVEFFERVLSYRTYLKALVIRRTFCWPKKKLIRLFEP